jgi:ABC-type glutathione transport system ATPase component
LEEIIRLDGVSKRFRAPEGPGYVQAADDVSLVVHRGETLAIVGESGSGKSTLARIALCLIPPDKGRVFWGGVCVSEMSAARLRASRYRVQPVFQDPASAFNPRHSMRESLSQAFRHAPQGRGPSDPELIALLESVGVAPGATYLKRYPHQLSGGQRQRVAIARAIALRPEVIVADEPLSGADLSIRGQILNLLRGLQERDRLGYFMITHDISLAREFADRVAVMHRGRIVEQGPAQTVMNAPSDPYTRKLLDGVPRLITD